MNKIRNHNPDPNTPEAAEKVSRLKKKAWRFCEEFKKELGSTTCGEVRPRIMGRDYDSMDPVEEQQLLSDDGPRKCRVQAETVVRIGASILLAK